MTEAYLYHKLTFEPLAKTMSGILSGILWPDRKKIKHNLLVELRKGMEIKKKIFHRIINTIQYFDYTQIF